MNEQPDFDLFDDDAPELTDEWFDKAVRFDALPQSLQTKLRSRSNAAKGEHMAEQEEPLQLEGIDIPGHKYRIGQKVTSISKPDKGVMVITAVPITHPNDSREPPQYSCRYKTKLPGEPYLSAKFLETDLNPEDDKPR